MGYLELFLLALGLSMDAFAVAVCKGLAMQRVSLGKACTVALWFGGFQALMPLLGYYLASFFQDMIYFAVHWIAFFLLTFIGINMIREAFSKEAEEPDDSLASGKMLVLALATSIDALAVGVTFACLTIYLLPAVSLIGGITFLCSIIGVKAGNLFGNRFQGKAKCAGGVILISIGLKIIIEYLFFGN